MNDQKFQNFFNHNKNLELNYQIKQEENEEMLSFKILSNSSIICENTITLNPVLFNLFCLFLKNDLNVNIKEKYSKFSNKKELIENVMEISNKNNFGNNEFIKSQIKFHMSKNKPIELFDNIELENLLYYFSNQYSKNSVKYNTKYFISWIRIQLMFYLVKNKKKSKLISKLNDDKKIDNIIKKLLEKFYELRNDEINPEKLTELSLEEKVDNKIIIEIYKFLVNTLKPIIRRNIQNTLAFIKYFKPIFSLNIGPLFQLKKEKTYIFNKKQLYEFNISDFILQSQPKNIKENLFDKLLFRTTLDNSQRRLEYPNINKNINTISKNNSKYLKLINKLIIDELNDLNIQSNIRKIVQNYFEKHENLKTINIVDIENYVLNNMKFNPAEINNHLFFITKLKNIVFEYENTDLKKKQNDIVINYDIEELKKKKRKKKQNLNNNKKQKK